MKKVLVLVFALVLAMSLLCTAVAETRSYAMTGITDTDGNVLCSVTDDGESVLDANGNDVTDQFPILVFVCDDEAMTGTWGNEDGETADCTLTEEEAEDGTIVVTATFEDASTLMLVYDQENDMFGYTDGDYVFVLTNVD